MICRYVNLMLMNLIRKLHLHNWSIYEYERKDSQFFRKAKFRICSCGLKQERVCGKWGPIVNAETLKEAAKFF